MLTQHEKRRGLTPLLGCGCAYARDRYCSRVVGARRTAFTATTRRGKRGGVMKRATAMLAAMLTACAAPPNTPGAGYGATYTPIVDMQGVDQSRYANDLAACRHYANSIDVSREQANAAIGGAIFAAAITAALGGNMRQMDQNASAGGLASMNRQTGRTMTRQETVLGNCLTSRGYRVLDGTAQLSFVQQVAPPAPQPVVGQPVTWAPAEPQASPAPVSPSAGVADGIVRLPTPAGNPAPAKPTGTDSYVAERVARQARCNDTALASLVAKGPGYENYSMQCTSGDVMMIRCEFGNCRALK